MLDTLWVALDASALVHGDARGVDRLVAAHIRRTRPDVCVVVFPANWQAFGRSAGHRRNADMLRANIGALIAFPGGRGTANCIAQAQRLGITVHFINDYLPCNKEERDQWAANFHVPTPA